MPVVKDSVPLLAGRAHLQLQTSRLESWQGKAEESANESAADVSKESLDSKLRVI